MTILIAIITIVSIYNPFLSFEKAFSNLNANVLAQTKQAAHDSSHRVWVTVTAYSSTPEQTDDTPFITAKGTTVRDGIIAANFLEFDTKVRIPELFGDKVFIVEDRMHRRFSDRVDIWFSDEETALRFGKQHTHIEILES